MQAAVSWSPGQTEPARRTRDLRNQPADMQFFRVLNWTLAFKPALPVETDTQAWFQAIGIYADKDFAPDAAATRTANDPGRPQGAGGHTGACRSTEVPGILQRLLGDLSARRGHFGRCPSAVCDDRLRIIRPNDQVEGLINNWQPICAQEGVTWRILLDSDGERAI